MLLAALLELDEDEKELDELLDDKLERELNVILLLVLLDELSEVLLFDRLLALVTERLVEDVETEFLELDVADN